MGRACAIRYLLLAIPALFVEITLAFLLMHIVPGGPFDQECALSPENGKSIKMACDLTSPC